MNTEFEFDTFFESVGYRRVASDLGASPDFENADYINQSAKTIIELKTIDKEHFPEGGIIDSLGAIVFKPVNIDPATGKGMYSFALPESNREGRPDQFEEPMRRILKKANRQIRMTKQHYFGTEGHGFGIICLALVGLKSLSPLMVGNLITRLLQQEFRSIDAFIVTRPYELLRDPISLEIHPEAVSYSLNRDPRIVKICFDLGEKWSMFRKNGGHPISK